MACLLVTRPEPDASALVAELEALGHTAIAAPAMTIAVTAEAPQAIGGYQALVFTSANGVRAFLAAGGQAAGPAFCVGAATAAEAEAAGFTPVRSAGGDVRDLAELIAAAVRPADGPLLHVAGSQRAGALAADLDSRGIALARSVLYRQEPASALPAAAVAALQAHRVDGAVFFSPRSAQHFAGLVQRANLTGGLARARAYCLSANVAAELTGLGLADIQVAERPDKASLLACLPPAPKRTASDGSCS